MVVPSQIKDTIESGRSIRSYQMKSVDRLVMDEIKEFAQGSGIQKARLLVSKRSALRLLAIMQTTDCHLMDRITKRTFSHRRKELVELLENEDDFRTVTIAMPQGYRHVKWEHPNVDIGICACYVWLWFD